MDMAERLRQQARAEGVAESHVLGSALARESLLWFFRLFPDLAIFVGGNVLHLLYGSPRYSRDLDLLPRRTVHPTDLKRIAQQLERNLQAFGAQLGQTIDCRIRSPEPPALDLRLAGQRLIALEFSRLSGGVHKTEAKLLRSESLASEVVVCPVLDELLLLKLKTLLKRRFFKARDVFDLWYLLSLEAKINKEEVEHWLALEEMGSEEIEKKLDLLSPRRLDADLTPLLPAPWLQKLRADHYGTIIQSVKRLFQPFLEP